MITKKWSLSPSVMKIVFPFWKVIITSSKKYLDIWVFTESFFQWRFRRNFSTFTKIGNHYGWSLQVIITWKEFHYWQLCNPQGHNQKTSFNLWVNFAAEWKNWAESAIRRFFSNRSKFRTSNEKRLKRFAFLEVKNMARLKNWAESAIRRFFCTSSKLPTSNKSV